MEMELITIIIPVYNAEKTVERCLESVINQSYKNLEILIINDGSGDKTQDICEDYARKDFRIKVFRQENKGVSAARNFGIKNATGKYLAFVDADDYIENNMIDYLHQMYQDEADIDLTICNCDIKAKEGRKMPEIQCIERMSQIQTVCNLFGPHSMCGYLCNKMFRTDIIRSNRIMLDETIYMCEDLLFCCQYALYIRKARYTEQRLYHYIMNLQGAVWSDYSKRQFTAIYAFEKMRNIVQDLDDSNVKNVLEAAYMVTCIRFFKKLLKKYHSFQVEEMKELMKGVRSIGWGVMCSDWGWKYKVFYIPLKILSQFYRWN